MEYGNVVSLKLFKETKTNTVLIDFKGTLTPSVRTSVLVVSISNELSHYPTLSGSHQRPSAGSHPHNHHNQVHSYPSSSPQLYGQSQTSTSPSLG